MIVHKFGGTSVGSGELFGSVADIVVDQQARTDPVRDKDEAAPDAAVIVIVSAMSGATNELITGARAAAEGKDAVYRDIKARLLGRHLEVVETMLTNSRERLEVGGLIEDRLHELERFYRSIAMLGELTTRGRDAVASFGEQLSSSILAAALRERGTRAQAVSATRLVVTADSFGAAMNNRTARVSSVICFMVISHGCWFCLQTSGTAIQSFNNAPFPLLLESTRMMNCPCR